MSTRRLATVVLVLASGLFVSCAAGGVRSRAVEGAPARSPDASSERSIVLDGAKGWLCIVGGGGTTDAMYERMLAAAGGKDAKVVILPQASELADTGAGSMEVWKKHGATDVEWLDLKDPARDQAKVRAAQVIWFPGGVQTRLMKALHEAGIVEIVRQRFVDGAVVGGTSAGAAVMSDVMITGDYDLGFKEPAQAASGSSVEDPPRLAAGTRRRIAADSAAVSSADGPASKGDPTQGADAKPPVAEKLDAPAGQERARAPRAAQSAEDEDSGLKYIRNGTNVFSTGLGLMQGAIVDQHFVRRQRFNRLLSAVLDHPDLVGIGIDEKTSILVHGNAFEVVGASTVLVLDARGARHLSKDGKEPGALFGATVSVLRAGMKYEFAR
ncbi:MAG: cyanophycinase [Planctomycetes bacterium]|nr:cyanophycinase [Planctomycetota bacterium]